jgi:hypothetical protein
VFPLLPLVQQIHLFAARIYYQLFLYK